MPECSNCGGHVATDYRRVFADNDGLVHGCPVCTAPGQTTLDEV